MPRAVCESAQYAKWAARCCAQVLLRNLQNALRDFEIAQRIFKIAQIEKSHAAQISEVHSKSWRVACLRLVTARQNLEILCNSQTETRTVERKKSRTRGSAAAEIPERDIGSYTLLRLTPQTEGFPWDDIRKIWHGGQRMVRYKMAKHITQSFKLLSRAYERYRRQTDLP